MAIPEVGTRARLIAFLKKYFAEKGSGGGGGTPGGSNTQIQFNNNGSFGASADLVWDTSSGDGLGIDITPKVHLDVNYGLLDALSSDTGGGVSVTFGTGTTVAGKLYYLNTSGVWTETDADAIASGATQLLGIALGTAAATHGMLLRGFFKMSSYLILGGVAFSASRGKPVFVSTTAANGDVTAPSATGDFVRVIGYCTTQTGVIYFNPSSTYIEYG